MQEIKIGQPLISIIPQTRIGCLECTVQVETSDDKIRSLSEEIISNCQAELTLETISQKPTIKSTKEAYRKLGKDPSRYRPSAEALTRRIINGKGLYWIYNIVDLLNLISLKSGYSIGGYDADKIVGTVEFGAGINEEPFEAIGRGKLNIEDLPVFRDKLGAFGSPTSDSLRTMVTDKTTRFFMAIIDFGGHENLSDLLDKSVKFFEDYVGATEIETGIFTTKK